MENVYELLYMSNYKDDYSLVRLIEMFDPLIKATIKMMLQKSNNQFLYDDLYQELSIILYDCIYKYREDYGFSFGTYLKRCLVNRATSIYREATSNKYRANYDTISLDTYVSEEVDTYRYEVIEQRDCLTNPQYIFEFTQTFREFKRYYENLNEFDKKVLVCYLEKMKYEDAARLLNVTKKTYDNKLQKLKKDIKIVFARV